MPNLLTIDQFMLFLTSNHLKILLTKWTIPVSVIASSVGKKTKRTGVRSVPNPNPEKKVSIAIPPANKGIINISSICILSIKILQLSNNRFCLKKPSNRRV